MAASTAAAAHVDKGSSRHGRPGGGKSRRPKHTPVATQRTEQPKRKGEDFLTPRGQGGTGSRGARKGEGGQGATVSTPPVGTLSSAVQWDHELGDASGIDITCSLKDVIEGCAQSSNATEVSEGKGADNHGPNDVTNQEGGPAAGMMHGPVLMKNKTAVACGGSEQATVTNKNNDEDDMHCDQAEQEVTGPPQDMVLPLATTGDQPACDKDGDIQMATSQTMEQPPKTIPQKIPPAQPPGQSSTCMQHNIHDSQSDIDDMVGDQDDMEVDGETRGVDAAGSSKRHTWWVCSENNKRGTGRPRCHECNELVEVGELRVRKTEHSGARVNHLKCVYSKMCAHAMLGNWQMLTKGTQDRVRSAYVECFATIAKAEWDEEIPKHEVEPVCAPLINVLGLEQSEPLSAAWSKHWSEDERWPTGKDRISTLSDVPQLLHADIANMYKDVSVAVVAAKEREHARDLDSSLKLFSALPRLLYAGHDTRGGKNGSNYRKHRRDIGERMSLIRAGEWKTIDTLIEERTVNQPTQKGPRAQDRDPDTALITNIEKNVGVGAISRALRLLEPGDGIASDAVADQLIPKHFRTTDDYKCPKVQPPGSEVKEAFLGMFAKVLTEAKPLTASGPHGGRYEHYKIIAQFPDAVEAVGRVAWLLATGDVPNNFKDFMRTRSFTPLLKPGGLKIRPIELDDSFARLTDTAVVRLLSADAADKFAPLQHGMRTANGGELLYKKIQAQLAEYTHQGTLALDIADAFGSLDRDQVWHQVCKHFCMPNGTEEPPTSRKGIPVVSPTPATGVGGSSEPRGKKTVRVPAAPFVQPVLHGATKSVHYGQTHARFYRRTAGIVQGGPWSAFLFCTAIQSTLEQIDARLKELDPNALLTAYMDDVMLCIDASKLAQALAIATEEFKKIKLVLNDTKSQAWSPVIGIVINCERVTRPTCMRLSANVTPLLNEGTGQCTITAEAPEILQLTDRRAKFLQALTRLQGKGMRMQTTWTLFRAKINGDWNWWARTTGLPPAVQQKLDSTVMKFLIESFVLNGTPHQLERLHHQLADGGTGIIRVSDGGPAALAASWAACYARVIEACKLDDFTSLQKLLPQASAALNTVRIALQASRDTEIPQPVDHTAKISQKLVMKLVHKKALFAWEKQATTEDKAWRLSCTGKAGQWLANPTMPEHIMTDADFGTALALRLGTNILPRTLGCPLRNGKTGQKCDVRMDTQARHALSCPCEGCLIKRHDDVRDMLAGWCRQNGCINVNTETHVSHREKNHCRSDIDYVDQTNGQVVHLDIAVVSPLSVQALEKGSARTPGVAAKTHEIHKVTKYSHNIIPIILEHGGREGARAREWVKSQLPDGHMRSQAAQVIWQSIAVSLQRANSKTIREIKKRYNGGLDPIRPH